MAKANPMMLQMLPTTFKMSISATSWNQNSREARYFAFPSAFAGSQATVFLPSTVRMSKHDRKRWAFTFFIIPIGGGAVNRSLETHFELFKKVNPGSRCPCGPYPGQMLNFFSALENDYVVCYTFT